MNWKQAVLVAAATLCLAGTSAYAQPSQVPPSRGPGMMGGTGPGYGPYWRGERDDDGGWGRMSGGGWGMGPGMMGGMGMMGLGLGPIARLDLSDAQRQQVRKIDDGLRHKNWEVMGKMEDEMIKLRDAWWASKGDRAGIIAAYKRVSDLRLSMVENALDARDQAEALLTPQQREQLKRYAW